MKSLAARVSSIADGVGDAPWAGYEYVRGWGVFGLPFDSGHVLALRVFPQNSFAPYRTVWHCDAGGRWSIFVDGPRLEVACPRYYGQACDYIGYSNIEVTWTGPRTLHVVVDDPALDWTLTVAHSFPLTALNAISGLLPTASWRPAALRRVRERIARALGMGDMRLSGEMPSGHLGVLMPERIHLIDDAQAVLDGIDLGKPTRVATNPMIGDVTLPARGVLAIGQGMWPIKDLDEFRRIRAEVSTPENS